MYKDIINYRLAESITEDQLLAIAGQIVQDWMKNQPGFNSWEIHKQTDGSYSDIVIWDSEADAKNAEKEMINIPNASKWYGCYKEGSISSKNLTSIVKF